MELVNVAGVFILSIMASIVLSIANADAYEGMSAAKKFGLWLTLMSVCFVIGVGTYIGVAMVIE